MIKFARRSLPIFFLGLIIASPVCAQKKLTATEAKQHFGETAIVCGEVVSANYAGSSKGHPTFLNFDKPYPKQIFTVVIWDENRSKFGKPGEAGLPEMADKGRIVLDSPFLGPSKGLGQS